VEEINLYGLRLKQSISVNRLLFITVFRDWEDAVLHEFQFEQELSIMPVFSAKSFGVTGF
jgi:hypothetical protein